MTPNIHPGASASDLPLRALRKREEIPVVVEIDSAIAHRGWCPHLVDVFHECAFVRQITEPQIARTLPHLKV